MPDDCDHWHRILAERALRDVDADTEAGALAHLASCAEARALADEFRTTAAALAHVRQDGAVLTASASTPHPYVPSPEHLYDRIASRLAAGRASRRRRTWAVGIAAALVVLGSIFMIASHMSHATQVASPGVSFTNDVVDGVVTLENRSWGTEIHLRAEGFTPGQQYNVWLERADGSRVGAGTFTGVTHQPVIVTLSSAVPESHAVAIGISEPDGTLVMRRSLT